MNSIFLVGPMGAGKTTIGRQLAKLLELEFVDSDHEIEAHTGASIPLIFEIEGEEGFRERESAMLDNLTQRDHIVLATGGGAVLRAQNREYLKTRGTTVYLHATVDNLLQRTRFDRNRPLLQTADPRAKLAALMQEREPFYREVASLVIDTVQGNPKKIANQIVKKLRQRSQN